MWVQERNIEGVGDGMVEGGAALGMGIYRGFTGLVTKPVEGAKTKGVGGQSRHVGTAPQDQTQQHTATLPVFEHDGLLMNGQKMVPCSSR